MPDRFRYSGNGPWRHLPPWKRPGWKYRSCWWGDIDDITYLEELAEDLERRLSDVRRRIDVLRRK